MANGEEDISQFREKIDETDRELVRLLMERALLVREIGERKRQDSTPVYRPDREKMVYENVLKHARGLYGADLPFPDSAVRHIWREIMSGSIAIEGGPGVAYLGPEGSFSHLAVRQKFGSSLRGVPVDTIPDVFRTVEADREASYGMVPVENSIEGTVTHTVDSFLESEIRVYAEEYVRIHLNLVHREQIPIEDIKKVYTIKIVREQSRNWLHKNLNPGRVEIIETPSSAVAARLAAERGDGAAIASDMAAETYGLKIIAPDVQDRANNITRFMVIANKQAEPTGDDKTSLILTVNDRPGSLYDILKPFHDAGINLSRIESRPSRKFYGDYNFFLDFLGHAKDPEIAKILSSVEERTSSLRILGSYPRVDVPI